MRPAIACAVLAILLARPGATAPLPDPSGPRWDPVSFPRIERETRYRSLPDGGVEARSDCGASARVLRLDGVDLARTPVLRWRWRVDEPLDVADERSRSGDDFAARVYVMFRFEPERASWLERARRRVATAVFGRELPGSALSFVWTSRVAPGAQWPNPYAEETRMVALAQGATGQWRTEQVDLPAAYRRAFGHEPPEAVALGLMTDADDTCGRAVARYADFSLDPRPAGPATGGATGGTPATDGTSAASNPPNPATTER